jgi:hypothetical protein
MKPFEATTFRALLVGVGAFWPAIGDSGCGGAPPSLSRQTVTVIAEFLPTVPKFDHINLIARLEDVTQEDGLQQEFLPEVVKSDIAIGGKSHALVSFAFRDVPINSRSLYNIRLILDLNRDGKLSNGDYVTQERFMFEGSIIPKNASRQNEVRIQIGQESLRIE